MLSTKPTQPSRKKNLWFLPSSPKGNANVHDKETRVRDHSTYVPYGTEKLSVDIAKIGGMSARKSGVMKDAIPSLPLASAVTMSPQGQGEVDEELPTSNSSTRRTHNPYAPRTPVFVSSQEYFLRFYIYNTAFERSDHIVNDCIVLFDWISEVALKAHMKERGVKCKTIPYVKFVSMHRLDKSVERDVPANNEPAPSKKRDIVVSSNVPQWILCEILCGNVAVEHKTSDNVPHTRAQNDRRKLTTDDRRLFVLADRHGFHACWDGLVCVKDRMTFDGIHIEKDAETRGEKQNHATLTHSKTALSEHAEAMHFTSIRQRHKRLEGLPCRPLAFEFVSSILGENCTGK